MLDLYFTQKGHLENRGCPSIAQSLAQHGVPREFPLPVTCASSPSSTVGMSVIALAQSREENEPGERQRLIPQQYAHCTVASGHPYLRPLLCLVQIFTYQEFFLSFLL